MRAEPAAKNVVAFIDGQNLFRSVKSAFGYSFPNYDLVKLSNAICVKQPGWTLKQIRFYTGIPKNTDDLRWHTFWKKKLSVMGRIPNIYIYTRELRYRILKLRDNTGIEHTGFGAVEKGIDVRIAIDITRLAHKKDYDVALVFSQDQDLSEVVGEISAISQEQDRWIKVASSFPMSPVYFNTRGINGSTWHPFDKTLYDPCIDPKDYR